jgi:hypothetical protein
MYHSCSPWHPRPQSAQAVMISGQGRRLGTLESHHFPPWLFAMAMEADGGAVVERHHVASGLFALGA